MSETTKDSEPILPWTTQIQMVITDLFNLAKVPGVNQIEQDCLNSLATWLCRALDAHRAEPNPYEVLGWAISYCCASVDDGKDIRKIEMPVILEAFQRDFATPRDSSTPLRSAQDDKIPHPESRISYHENQTSNIKPQTSHVSTQPQN